MDSFGADMNLTERIYSEIVRLPRFDHTTPSHLLPENGVYVFFEPKESLPSYGDSSACRIVRVGTHREDGRLRRRIRNHYCSDTGGDRRQSVFRRHVGGALLRRIDLEHPELAAWFSQEGMFPAIEAQVSKWLRENTYFRCFLVDDRDERRRLESGLIALFSQHPLGNPSDDWLGKHAVDERVRHSGLWNSNHVFGAPLTQEDFDLLSRRIHETFDAEEVQMNEILVIIPCGKGKIWDKKPHAGALPARDVYAGAPFKVNREYAETFGDRWVILSAKYGFINPDFLIPETYNVTFKKRSSGPVSVAELKEQVAVLGLDKFPTVIALGGKEYRAAVREALASTPVRIHAPFERLTSGKMMQATKEAIRLGQPGI